MDGYRLIEDAAALADLRGGLDPSLRWALDTEFVRERTYLPRLCLVQLAVSGQILLLDPLRIGDTMALAGLLADARRPYLVHAARQDVEALLPLTGSPLAPLFDTQVAASLLGFPSQIGYGDLVRQVLGVELAKGHARTDWAARPLAAGQLAYAADDVRYLGAVAETLGARLEDAGRLGWCESDCAALSDAGLYRIDPADAWKRIKGLERMAPAERTVACALAAWREERASRRNLPRGWVLSDEALRELARVRPGSTDALGRIGSLPGRAAAKLAGELLPLIADATRSGEDVPLPAVDRLTPAQQATVRRLQEVLRDVSGQLDISPEVLATRRDLTAMVRGASDEPPLTGWRRDVIGSRLLTAI